jgi:hypothetical protein
MEDGAALCAKDIGWRMADGVESAFTPSTIRFPPSCLLAIRPPPSAIRVLVIVPISEGMASLSIGKTAGAAASTGAAAAGVVHLTLVTVNTRAIPILINFLEVEIGVVQITFLEKKEKIWAMASDVKRKHLP